MPRIDARRTAAKVIGHEVIWQWADELLVGHSVGKDLPRSDNYPAATLMIGRDHPARQGIRPKPHWSWLLGHYCESPCNRVNCWR